MGFVRSIAFLADLTSHLNVLNLKLQIEVTHQPFDLQMELCDLQPKPFFF
jgi:hypothetical protein